MEVLWFQIIAGVQSIGALSLNVYREDECAKILLNGYFSLRWDNSIFEYNNEHLAHVLMGNTFFEFVFNVAYQYHMTQYFSTSNWVVPITCKNIQICTNDFQFPPNPLVLKRFPLYITTSPSSPPTGYPLRND